MGVKERLLDFINYKQITNKLFELTAGLSNGYINNFDGNFRTKTLEKVLTAYPELNRNWLLYGEGEMLVADTTPRIVDAAIISDNEEVEVDIVGIAESQNITLHDIATIIGESVTYIEDCKGKLYPRHIMKLQERFGDIVDRFVKYSNTLAVEVIEHDNSSAGIPIVTDAVLSQRGLDIKKYIEKNGSELQSIDPHKLFAGAEFAVEMFKDSMAPDIMAGDKVILQFLPKDAKLQSGAMYFINSIPYADVVRDVFIDGDIATLKARNKRYGDIVLNIKTDILRVANVLGVYRNTFNSSYAQLDELRRTKEEQLNRFIDMQSEMIAEIREQGKRNERERERTDMLIDKFINK
jgi:SOS-response transcriptional repressor LexA